jgi:hypothetical protein
MFPSTTIDRPSHRSVRELMKGALGTALEFATLGEATLGAPAPAPPVDHPHRQALVRPRRPRRPGAGPARPSVCTLR